MVRFNKEKGATGVYTIDTKEDALTVAPTIKEPVVPQQSNAELEKFSAQVLKVLGDENIPPTPSNFQIYFDKLLENKPAAFKKRINEFLDLETTNNDENHVKIEREIKEGFSQIKNIMQVVSTVYRNLGVMQDIVIPFYLLLISSSSISKFKLYFFFYFMLQIFIASIIKSFISV
ncbi:hypothetical protein [Sulfurospirillum cavolei]|uniref:hypothetical protein n=1 Tax=Sulfurospirillum cavolei TaxID=366522 RepID=UPI000A987F41|nr:hypothetical protein [Sulfurospirillum cavolei]